MERVIFPVCHVAEPDDLFESVCLYFPRLSVQTHYQLRVPPCGSGKDCVVSSLEFCSGRAACRALGLQTLVLADAVEPFQTPNIRNSSGSTELQKKKKYISLRWGGG